MDICDLYINEFLFNIGVEGEYETFVPNHHGSAILSVYQTSQIQEVTLRFMLLPFVAY